MLFSGRMKVPRRNHSNNGYEKTCPRLFGGGFRLIKKQWMIPLSAALLIGLSGCSSNNRANVSTESQNSARPIGYYSNESHRNNGNGLTVDNDGPVTEFMDHQFGNEGRIAAEQKRQMLQTRDENGNPLNPTKPLAKNDRNFLMRDNQFSTSDYNYHGHMNRRYGNAGVVTDAAFQDKVTNQIRGKVAAIDNVRSIRSVVYGNIVTVSVKLDDNSKAAATKKAIRKAVKPYADGRYIQVYVDEGALGRDRNFRNDIQQRPR
jgi:spore cortex protein